MAFGKQFKIGKMEFNLSGGRIVMIVAGLFILTMIVLVNRIIAANRANVPQGAKIVGSAPPTPQATVGGAGTPDYNRAVRESNQQIISQAEKEGKSAIATPVDLSQKNQNSLALLDQQALPARNPSAPMPAASLPQLPLPPSNPALTQGVPNVSFIAPRPYENPAITSQMNAIIDRMSAIQAPVKTVIYHPYAPIDIVSSGGSSPTTTGAASAPRTTTTQNALLRGLLKPGSVLYAQFTTSIESDIPSVVVAQIEQGPLSGYKILGSWKRANDIDALTIEFDRLVLPDGSTLAFKGYAVDPNNGLLPALASEVDRQVLMRAANFLGATFLAVLNGYSTAYAQAGEQVIQSPSSTVVTTPPFTAQQAKALALQQATQALQPLQSMMMQKVMQPNIVKVNQGQGFGLLIVSGISAS